MDRSNPAAFQKGRAKTGGRVKGTPNKVNSEQRARIEKFFEKHWDEFENEIWPSLTDKDKKDTFVALMNYRYPKLACVAVNGTVREENKALDVLRDAVQDSSIV